MMGHSALLIGYRATDYVYGTTLSDSLIASSMLKRAEIYPDSVDGSDKIFFEYNRQGETTKITDQAGTVHEFDFDLLGRQTHDRVTGLGSGVDGAVRRISSTFEVRGMRESVASYDNATVGSGSVVNDTKFTYNSFGQLTADYQSHSGAVNTGSSPKVQYAYASGSANTIRPTTITYPNGRVVTYGYDSSNSMADALSRVAAVIDDDGGATHLADYSYLGQQSFVETDYTQSEVRYTLVGTAGGDDPDTGDIYRGLDRFGSIKDSYWYNYGTSADADRIKYGYDRAGSRIWRENVVARSQGKYFDEKYLYDEIHRLKDVQRGELNNLQSSISNLQFSQCWGLDETGNWSNFREDNTGAGSWTLNQSRTSNTVNEITDITETVGASWVTPVYSRAGNMTTMPQPASPANSYTATYDAWNRLVKIADGANTVSEYQYDGAKRRVVQKSYVSGTLNETRHLYYTEPSKWQVVEERVGTSTSANRQFVWGKRYTDDLVLRDCDANEDGILEERLYALQDGNWNVTSIIDVSGTVQQRFNYDAYGMPKFLTSGFASSTNTKDFETTYAGYRFEDATTLFHVRNRVLNVTFGAWVQRDPIGYVDGTSLFQYVKCSPLRYVDPTGKIRGEVCEVLLSDCLGNGIGCLCGLISTLDAFGDSLPVVIPPIPPFLMMLLDGADCFCDLLDVMTVTCNDRRRNCKNSWQIFYTAFITSGSCLIDILSLGGVSGKLGNLYEKLLEAIEWILDFIEGRRDGGKPGEQGVLDWTTQCFAALKSC